MTFELYFGDCVETMAGWPENSVDAIVTDPPAGIGFMNRKWDSDRGGRDFWVQWFTTVAKEMHRLLKPGAWGFVWAIPRTSHWTAWGLEDGGFAIRDINHHLFGTGNPKTTDKATIPSEWAGWNTALKGAAEHWILIRKEPEGTLAENLQKWGAGALNIDASRQPVADLQYEQNASAGRGEDARQNGEGFNMTGGEAHALGRWPANVTLDESAVDELDAQAGERGAKAPVRGTELSAAADTVYNARARVPGAFHADSGGPSRWWYVAKPSRSEKEAGCEHIPLRSAGEVTGGRAEGSAGLGNARAGAGRTSGARNYHPTVKSIALMRRLVKMVTPPGGIVLDPFAGSGTTGIAAVQEGFDFVGVEKEFGHLAIANARITYHGALK